jgi:hypothetical protein
MRFSYRCTRLLTMSSCHSYSRHTNIKLIIGGIDFLKLLHRDTKGIMIKEGKI